jgi:hypothetical protein
VKVIDPAFAKYRLGVAVVGEKKTAGSPALAKGEPHRAAIRVESVTLDFSPRNRDENVTA